MSQKHEHQWTAKLRSLWLSAAVLVTSGICVAPAYGATTDRLFFRVQSVVVVIGATENEAKGGVAPVVVDFNLLTPGASGSPAADIIGVDGYVFNSNSGFDPGHDFSGGGSRFDLKNTTFGGAFENLGGGDIDYLEATDSLTGFGLDNTTDLNVRQSRHVSRFLVVSNTPFDMYAHASNLTRTGDFTALGYENIGFRAIINRTGGSGVGQWGSAAQNPSVGGGGIDININDLSDLSAGPTKFFDGGRRTARNSGSLLEQSVSFNIRYALSGAADASDENDYDFALGVGTIGADVTYTIYTP